MRTVLVSIKDVGEEEDGRKKCVCIRIDQSENTYKVVAIKEKIGPNWEMYGAPIEVMDECISDIEKHWSKYIYG